jgi:molybdenum cofactor cytidylyltransferase
LSGARAIEGRIAGVLLAAGAGTRFGGRKLLHPLIDGVPVGLAALRNLKSALPHLVTVVRPGDEELLALLTREGVPIIECPEAHRGMGHSLAAGVAAVRGAGGWVIALGDMPHIRSNTIRAVAQALEQGAEIAVPVFAGQRGHPVGFGSRFRDHLLALSGDAGARPILAAHASAVHQIEVGDPGVVQDLDTPADASRLAKRQIDGDRG